MMGRWDISFTRGTTDRSSVLRVAVSNVRIPRSQRITWWFPSARIYSAAARNSSMVALMPRFSSTGFWSAPPPAAGRNSAYSGHRPADRSAYSATSPTLSGLITSVTIGSPVSLAGHGEKLQSLLPQPLKRMRTGPRFESASPQHICACSLDRPGGLEYLILAFHRAGPGDDDGPLPFADHHSADLDHRAARMEITGNQLVRFGDMDHLLNPRQIPYGRIVHISLIPEDTDRGSFAARESARPSDAHFFDSLDNRLDLPLSRLMVHDDKHDSLRYDIKSYESRRANISRQRVRSTIQV